MRNLGVSLATYGLLLSLSLIFMEIGLMAASLYFLPEAHGLIETYSKLSKHSSFKAYQLIIFAWLVVNIALPNWYLASTIILLTTIIIYPTRLLTKAKAKTQSTHVRDMLTVLSISWSSFLTLAFALFALGTDPPVLGVSLPYAWSVAFVATSAFFLFMAQAVIDPAGISRPWTAFLVPETVPKLGGRYLILHDAGDKAVSFISTSLRSLIEAGARIIITSSPNVFLQALIQNDQRLKMQAENGKITSLRGERIVGNESVFPEKQTRNMATVYVQELAKDNLFEEKQHSGSGVKDASPTTELLLLQSSDAPRIQVAEFLRRNTEVQLLDLSEPKAPFSSLIKLDHVRLEGSTILLEYDSSARYEGVVDKFLAEGAGNAEVCVLFTAKSSKLYRAIKGKKFVKVIAASSLVSAPDELPDGEVQIPDRELGLVSSITSDFIENNRTLAVSFVFDSIPELIGGERWEQVYSGIKQLVELVSVPTATTLFLAGQSSLDPHFLGSLRAIFPIQLSLDSMGLRVVKIVAQ